MSKTLRVAALFAVAMAATAVAADANTIGSAQATAASTWSSALGGSYIPYVIAAAGMGAIFYHEHIIKFIASLGQIGVYGAAILFAGGLATAFGLAAPGATLHP